MTAHYVFASLVVIGLAAGFWLRGGPNPSETSAGGSDQKQPEAHAESHADPSTAPGAPVAHTDAEWRQLLTPQQYHILREKGTERAFTGAYWNNHEKGQYECAACGLVLFDSETKFDSGTGWPSFYQALAGDRVKLIQDESHGMVRTEVVCARCGGHLGHLFDDGPAPTGQRFCMNSASLKFDQK